MHNLCNNLSKTQKHKKLDVLIDLSNSLNFKSSHKKSENNYSLQLIELDESKSDNKKYNNSKKTEFTFNPTLCNIDMFQIERDIKLCDIYKEAVYVINRFITSNFNMNIEQFKENILNKIALPNFKKIYSGIPKIYIQKYKYFYRLRVKNISDNLIGPFKCIEDAFFCSQLYEAYLYLNYCYKRYCVCMIIFDKNQYKLIESIKNIREYIINTYICPKICKYKYILNVFNTYENILKERKCFLDN